MKKTIILLTLVLLASFGFAQKGKVTSALTLKESGKLDKALETIELTIDPNNEKAEKSIPWPRTWEVRGEIFQAIYQTKDENFKKLSEEPLTVAFDSYKKALELDEKDKFGKSLKIKFTLLTTDLTNQAVEFFQVENFAGALKSFEQILEIEEIPMMKADSPEAIDTVIIFNAGLAAYNAKDYDKAIKYYSEAAKHNYNGGRTFQLISQAYELKNDSVGALKALQDGFKKYPADNGILVKMINFYLNSKKTDDAMKYLELAIKQDPQNPSFYFAQGTLFDQIDRPDDAITSYRTAIEYDDNYFDAYYNLGALYYNKGVKQVEVAQSLPTNVPQAEYDAELAKADEWFVLSLPFMEKCFSINDKDPSTLESLKNLYYRMKNMDKYNEINEIIENL